MRLLEGEPPTEIVALASRGCHDLRMGNEEPRRDAGAAPTAPDGRPNGPASGSTAHDTIAVAPTPPPTGSVPGVLDAVRSAFAGVTSRRALGWVLLVAWAVWLVAVWVVQPRLVPQGLLADDLAQGRVTSYRVVTVDEDGRRGPASGPYRVNVYPAGADHSEVADGEVDGRPVTVAYWVDSPVASLRVLEPNGISSGTVDEVVAGFRDAGVPEASASAFFRGLPADRAYNAAFLLLLATLSVVILGPRPRRGTRWFWFWLTVGPLLVVVPVFAVAELLRPRDEAADTVHPPGVAGRWSGLKGWGVGIVLSVGGGWVLSTLSGVAPIWFIRG